MSPRPYSRINALYGTGAWSSIVGLSVRSVAAGSMSAAIPDFTRGLWRTMKPLGIAELHATRA